MPEYFSESESADSNRGYDNPTGYVPDPNVQEGGTGPSALQPDEVDSMKRFGWMDPHYEIRDAHELEELQRQNGQRHRFFAPTSRADWRDIESDCEPQTDACMWDYTDDKGVTTVDMDGLEKPVYSPVAALANRSAFSPQAIATACLAIRKDPLLAQRPGILSVDAVSVSGFDMHGLMQDIIALIDLVISGGFEQGYDEVSLYEARLLVQYLRNAEARRVHEVEGR